MQHALDRTNPPRLYRAGRASPKGVAHLSLTPRGEIAAGSSCYAGAEPAPQATAAGSVPTPTQHECDQYVLAMVAGSLPHVVKHAMDGSPIDPQSFDATPVTSPTWP
jgi:hypothetical protein